MKKLILILIPLFLFNKNISAQTITYSQVEKADNRNADFEILGRFGENYIIYKYFNRRQNLTVYNTDMTIKESIKLDFISDKTSNIDFVTYPDHFVMIWQYQKGNVVYCKGADMDASGRIIGEVLDLDTTRVGFFESIPSYDLSKSEDKKFILLYKVQTRNDVYAMTAKIFDGKLQKKDSTKVIMQYNDRRESFGDVQIDNRGTIVFTKERQNARPEFINAVTLNSRKLFSPQFVTTDIPLDKKLIKDVHINIDNLNDRYVLNSFTYLERGDVAGIFAALIKTDSFKTIKTSVSIFDDSVISKLSGRPSRSTAYNNFFMKNIILKKDGGYIIAAEEYSSRNRNGALYDDPRYGASGMPGVYNRSYYASPSDYYLYNRGYYGYYRPYGSNYARDMIYTYNDILTMSFSSDLKAQWVSIFNKETSDVENDNFLSFSNMNAGGEIHFLFLQKDNNKQVISDHALQPDGNIVRYATLKSRENGYYFMPRLARQTGAREMIMPCVVRNNIAFAKIDF